MLPGDHARWSAARTRAVAGTELRRSLLQFALNGIAGSTLAPRPLRYYLLRACGLSIDTFRIGSGCFFGGPEVTIGAGSTINHRCFFDTTARITIGRNTHIGPGVMFCTASHEPGDAGERVGAATSGEIVVEDGCGIAAGAILLAGVRIGSGSIVAAGTVVGRDLGPNGLYAGSPVRLVKRLDAPPRGPAAVAAVPDAEPAAPADPEDRDDDLEDASAASG
ncbi:MAG: acyltransferase [Solirubrobacteraceae bacterium]